MTLLVTLNERWLADVGFGDSFREPLLLDEPGVQTQASVITKSLPRVTGRILSNARQAETGSSQYRFTLQPHVYADYAEMCHFHQTSPDSHFTKAPICSLATSMAG